jgi:hypothetical protein
MRRAVLAVLVGCALLSPPGASAKFGIGKTRVATLEVSLGEGPGGWSSWRADLGALRPRPARVTDVKVVVEGGTVRLDRLAVRER